MSGERGRNPRAGGRRGGTRAADRAYAGRAIGELPVVRLALGSDDPVLRFKARRRLRDGQPIRDDFRLIQYPIRFFDVLFALTVMAETGTIGDPHCREALEVLAEAERSGHS